MLFTDVSFSRKPNKNCSNLMAGVPKKGWKETLILFMKARFIGIFMAVNGNLMQPETAMDRVRAAPTQRSAGAAVLQQDFTSQAGSLSVVVSKSISFLIWGMSSR